MADASFDPGRLLRTLEAEGFRGVTLRPVGAGIEDVFIERMHHGQ